MRKLLVFFVVGIFIFSARDLLRAQEKGKSNKPLEKAQAIESSKEKKPNLEAGKLEVSKPGQAKEVMVKAPKYRLGGLVVSIDSIGKKISIQQNKVHKERKVTLVVDKKLAEELTKLKVGDAVNVWVIGNKVTALQKVF